MCVWIIAFSQFSGAIGTRAHIGARLPPKNGTGFVFVSGRFPIAVGAGSRYSVFVFVSLHFWYENINVALAKESAE